MPKNSKIERTCPNCSGKYLVYPSEYNKRNFCSIKCKKQFNWETVTCKNCGKEFSARKSREAKFCSTKCSYENIHNLGLEKRICRNCNEEFEVLKSSSDLCCSNECYDKWKSKHEKVLYHCDYCGKEFMLSRYRFDNNLTGCYCSETCSQNSQIKGKHIFCKNCGKSFYKMRSKFSTDNFCSRTCTAEYIHKINSIEVECEMCDKTFVVKKSKENTARFCSNECKNKWQSLYRIGENSPTWKGGLVNYQCNNCGKSVKIKPSRINRTGKHFCSYSCRDAYYSHIENRTDKQKIADKLLSKNAIKYIRPYYSKPHQLISEYLKSINISHQNEKLIHYYRQDIFLNDYNLGIEINGDFWHCNPNRYKEILYFRQLKTIYKDKSKDTYVKNKYGYNVLYLWEFDIMHNFDLCKLLIAHYIKNNGLIEDYNSFNYEITDGELVLKSEIKTPYQCMSKTDIKKYVELKDAV